MVFRGCVEVVFRIADDEIARDAGLVASEESAEGAVEEETLRGDFERALPLPFAPAFRKGEAVRLPPTGGVPVREGGLLGRLIAGLSQEEKKSSDGSPAGVFEPSGVPSSAMSVIVTSSGNLEGHWHRQIASMELAHLQPLIRRNSPIQLFLVLGRSVGHVLDFRVFAR